jgi:DUF971 family protein
MSKPVDIQVIGPELAIKWDNASESYLRLDALRRSCPCAGCQGEPDVMGRVHRGPQKPLNAQSFQLRSIQSVGGYAIQPVWEDGHNTGLFTFDYLRKIATAATGG